nr:RdRp [Wugcerasp virus 16]WVD52804.1 RdRp [Wugcerasp virus 17]
MSNLKYLGTFPDRAPSSHPSYQSYRHINPVLKAMSRHLPQREVEHIVNGYRRSDFSMEALIADYFKGEVPKHHVIKDEHYRKALQVTSDLFRPKHKYRPVSFPDIRYYPWPLATSAEAPYTNSPYWRKYTRVKHALRITNDERVTFHNLYNEIFRHNREKIHRIKDGIYTDRFGQDLKYWNQAHARSHLVKADDPDKIRMVFGVPRLLIMAECMFLWPLVNDLMNRNGPMLWGFETLRGGWYATYRWLSTTEPRDGTYLAFDWKQFDKRAQFSVIDDIHSIIENYIDFEHGYIPTFDYPDTTTNPNRLKSLWRWTCNAVKHTPDILPDGRMFERQHAGIASGFFQTQLLDSMYNTVMLLTVLSKLGINIDRIKIKVQGDDSLIAIPNLIPESHFESFISMFASTALTYFGSILNEKKSKMQSHLEGLPVLGFTNHFGSPVKDAAELLANLLYPERKSDENRLMARAVGIAYANCGYHPHVYRICEDIFTYLHGQGFSPNAAGLPHLILALADWRETIQVDGELKFPSYYDTIAHLNQIPKRSETQKERTWPTKQFILPY